MTKKPRSNPFKSPLWTKDESVIARKLGQFTEASDLESLRHSTSAPYPMIFLAIPSGTLNSGFFTDTNVVAAYASGLPMKHAKMCVSSLTHNFNVLYSTAWNNRRTPQRPAGFTHFCMMHDDLHIYPGNWLKILYDTLVEYRLECLSATLPIKDARGITSTAFDTHLWRPRRVTQYESLNLLPEVWTSEDVLGKEGYANSIACTEENPSAGWVDPPSGSKLEGPIGNLLLNTGLMILDLSAPWTRDVVFEFRNKNWIDADGNMISDFEPEDWRFSRFLASRRVRYGTTRRIPVGHIGMREFKTHEEWGTKWDQQNTERDSLYGERKVASETVEY